MIVKKLSVFSHIEDNMWIDIEDFFVEVNNISIKFLFLIHRLVDIKTSLVSVFICFIVHKA